MKRIHTFERFLNEELNEREFSAEDRAKMADKGIALPDGSYPIENEKDLRNAIFAFGRSKNPSAVAKHIEKRAKALGKENLIPTSDKFQKALKQ
jgi:hypothetical protein